MVCVILETSHVVLVVLHIMRHINLRLLTYLLTCVFCCCCRDLPDGINDSDITVNHVDRVHPAVALRRAVTLPARTVVGPPTLRLSLRSSPRHATSSPQPASTEPHHRHPGRSSICPRLSTGTGG